MRDVVSQVGLHGLDAVCLLMTLWYMPLDVDLLSPARLGSICHVRSVPAGPQPCVVCQDGTAWITVVSCCTVLSRPLCPHTLLLAETTLRFHAAG